MKLTIKSAIPEGANIFYQGKHLDPVMFIVSLLERFSLDHGMDSLEQHLDTLLLEACELMGLYYKRENDTVILWARSLGHEFNIESVS